MAERPSVDWNKMSTASRILSIAGLLYFIDLFLTWNRVCGGGVCATVSGWHGIGILNGILVLIIILMEIVILLNVEINVGTPQLRNMVEAAVAGALLLFTLIRLLVKPSIFGVSLGMYFWAWIGLVLAIGIAYGGYMRWQESTVTPPSSGGFAS